MSNDETHDPQEPTGARLTDAQVAYMIEHAQYWLRYQQNRRCNPKTDAMSQLSNNVFALLADRAARVAEVARLQASLHSSHQMIGEIADELTRVEDQNLAMRPLVERIARGDFHEFYVSIFGDTCCIGCNATASTHIGFTHDDNCIVQAARTLVATWQPPAAPTPDGAIIIPDDPREQARIQREIILDSGVDFAEHYAGLVDDPTDDDDAPTPDGQEGGEG